MNTIPVKNQKEEEGKALEREGVGCGIPSVTRSATKIKRNQNKETGAEDRRLDFLLPGAARRAMREFQSRVSTLGRITWCHGQRAK